MRFLLTILTLFTVALPAYAGTLSQDQAALFDLNRASPGAMAKHALGTRIVDDQVRVLTATYDFAIQGGAPGTFNLLGPVTRKPVVIPKGAIITDCIIDVLTPGTTSASGTMALTAQSAADLKAALAAASYTGRVACIPVGSAATAIKLTADRTLTYTIATGALSNGKWDVKVTFITGR